MKKNTKYIIASVALVIFITTVSLMIWLGVKSNNDDNYIHKSYTTWLAAQTASPETYSRFLIDEQQGIILATSKEHGTYIIDASTSIIQQLTQVGSNGAFTSTLIQGISPITFGTIFETKETSLGIWMVLSIVSMGSLMTLLQMGKKLINKK